jgi:monovalent cation/hydrogen antiporter
LQCGKSLAAADRQGEDLNILLAIGLALFTVVGLALAAGSLLAGFDWKAAVLLGAVAAATDAIAATPIARRVGLPQRFNGLVQVEWMVR